MEILYGLKTRTALLRFKINLKNVKSWDWNNYIKKTELWGIADSEFIDDSFTELRSKI